jgi:hypothetical protein
MSRDLDLVGDRYSLIVLVFFIPYVLFQPPATVVIRKIGPRRFLSAITILWGATMIVCPLLSSSHHLLTYPRDSASCKDGTKSLASELSLVSSKQVTFQDVPTSSQHGTPATSCKSGTPSSLSSASWHPPSPAS